jgi:tetratricopeptide (TPR) repeat protein
MRRSPTLSINYGERQIGFCGRALRLNKRFFNLYCYLTVMRLEDPGKSGGYAECEQIRHLPGWTRNTPLSVGKQISRHMLSMGRGQSAVESEQRVGGPFRLRVPPSRISLDIPTGVLVKHLSLEGGSRELSDEKFIDSLKVFTDRYWRGASNFNDGKFSQALRQFRLALEATDRPAHWLVAAFYIRRIHDRRGDFEEAARLRQDCAERIKKSGKYWAWARAKDLSIAAWAEFELHHLDEGEKLYTEALSVVQGWGFWDILGDIHNGLGGITQAKGDYPTSLSHYLRALDAWLLVDYFYGLQAVYFNIAVIHKNWGNQLHDEGNATAARERYHHALKWADASVTLAMSMAVGDDTAEAELLLSDVNRRLGRFEKALKYASDARDHAERIGNQRSFVLSVRAYAGVLLDQGKADEALAHVRQHLPSMKPSMRRVLGLGWLALLGDVPGIDQAENIDLTNLPSPS